MLQNLLNVTYNVTVVYKIPSYTQIQIKTLDMNTTAATYFWLQGEK